MPLIVDKRDEDMGRVLDKGDGERDGRRGRFREVLRLALLFSVFGLKLICPKAAVAQQQPTQAKSHAKWVGRRVVQRSNGFTLQIENRIVDRKRVIHFYRVEQVNGPWLWVRADGNGFSGWAQADQVVPVDEAIPFFTDQLRANPADAFAYTMRATLYQDKKQFDLAARDYEEAIRLSPNQAWLYNDRGILYWEMDQYDHAIADFNQALRLEPGNANAYNNRGTVWRAKKIYDEAIADFSEAIRLNPDYAYAYYNRGLTRADKKLYDGAIADFDEVIRLDPKDTLAYYNRGLAWAEKKEYDSAIADFDRTIRMNAKFSLAYYHRGLAWAAKKDNDRAIADLNRTIGLSPKNSKAYYNRGLAWAEKKDYSKAMADYDQAIRLDPRFDEAYLSRAWLLATSKDARFHDPKLAVESATKACELTDWRDAHDLGALSAVYAETGNLAAAVKWQSKAIELMTGEREAANTVQIFH